jgi:hypothetical protein
MTNWNNKDKRISFLSIFRTLIGEAGFNPLEATPANLQRFVEISNKIVDDLFIKYSTDEVSPEIVELAESLEEDEMKGVDFGSEEELEYIDNHKKPYNGNKREPKIGDHFTGKTGDEMTYRKCESCGKAQWFKGNYKKCYDCNMKSKR